MMLQYRPEGDISSYRHRCGVLNHVEVSKLDADNCGDAESNLSVPMPPQHTVADTQWEFPALTYHSYVPREPVNKPTCHKQTQCGGAEPLTHTTQNNDTSSVLYTGLTLLVFSLTLYHFCRNSTQLTSG